MFNIQNDLLKERRNFNVKSLFYFKLFEANFKPAVPMQVNKLQFSTLNSNFITFFISDIKFYNIAKLKTSNTNSYFIQKDQKNTFSCFSTEVNKKFSSIQSKNNILFKNLKFFYNFFINSNSNSRSSKQ